MMPAGRRPEAASDTVESPTRAGGNRTRPTAAGTPEAMSFVSEMIRGQMY